MSDKTLDYFKEKNENFPEEMPRMENTKVSSMKTMSGLIGDSTQDQMSLSFPGCGFLSFYYLGVNACLKKYGLIDENTIICGASSGVMTGLLLLLDLPLGMSSSMQSQFFNNF